MASARTFYYSHCTFFEMLLELAADAARFRLDPGMTKEDVLDSVERRVSFLVGKLAVTPTCTAFQVLSDTGQQPSERKD